MLIERVLLAAFIALFPIGTAALLSAQLWAPLVYLFWMAWPLTTGWLLARTEIGVRYCCSCRIRVWVAHPRCWHCHQPLWPDN